MDSCKFLFQHWPPLVHNNAAFLAIICDSF
jgi:hypothetical protein